MQGFGRSQMVYRRASLKAVVDSLEQQLLVGLLIVYNPRGTDIRFDHFPAEHILI